MLEMQNFDNLDDNQLDSLRNQLRDFVSGVKDPNEAFVSAVVAAHGSGHASGHASVRTK
jgi:hypothetical protein